MRMKSVVILIVSHTTSPTSIKRVTAPVLPTEVVSARSQAVCHTVQSAADSSLSHSGKDPATLPPAAPAGVIRTILRGEPTAHRSRFCYCKPRSSQAKLFC